MLFQNLLTSQLVGAENTEVVVSQVEVPPNTTLPRHWHPGEEFAYIMSGSVTLWQEGKEDTYCKKGDVVVVPFKQVHTISTGDEAVSILIFRVHESGQPERILVEQAVA